MTNPAFTNVAAHLPALALRQPHALAVVCAAGRDRRGRARYIHYTYRQLDEESNCLARGLEQIGIVRGVRTVLMVNPGLDFFALTFALFKAGAVPVLIDPGMGMKNLGRCLAESEPAAFIGIPRAHLARRLLGWGRHTLRVQVTVGRRWFWGGYTVKQIRELGQARTPYEIAATNSGDLAAVLFTSGSTGAAKGVRYTHGIFAAQVEMLRKTYDIRPGEIDVPTFPLFALFAPALGMTAVIPDMDASRPAHVDPRKIIEAVEDFGATSLFGSPALLDRVGRHGETHNVRLPSLKRVLSAGAPVSAEVLERFAKMLAPGTQVFTPYGATEALPVASIGSDEILGETRHQTAAGAGVCVGRPIDPVHVAVIRIGDEPIPAWSDDLLLPTGAIGEIVVQGPIVTRHYYNRPEADALAKIADPVHNRFYHRMGDLGYLDDKGRLWFCGRKSQRVVTPDGTLHTIPCEAVFNAHPKVRRTALVGVGTNGSALPVLCVELRENYQNNKKSLRQELLALGAARPHTQSIESILFHPCFPVDVRHNAKIFREKLAVWAARQVDRTQ